MFFSPSVPTYAARLTRYESTTIDLFPGQNLGMITEHAYLPIGWKTCSLEDADEGWLLTLIRAAGGVYNFRNFEEE